MEDRVYLVWESDEDDHKNLITICKKKDKAQRIADDLRHKYFADNDDDNIDYFVEGKDVE